MNYAEIKYYDIANGPGVRTSLFVSGCRHHCPGCFNQVAWDFGFGKPFDKPTRNAIFAACQPDYISGLSLLGGAVPQQNGMVLLRLHLGAADRRHPLPRPVRSHRPAAEPAGRPGGRPVRPGGV